MWWGNDGAVFGRREVWRGKEGDGCDERMVKRRGRQWEINGSKVPESGTDRRRRRQQGDLEVSDVRKCDAHIIKGFMDYSLWMAEQAKKLRGWEKFFTTLHKVEQRCGVEGPSTDRFAAVYILFTHTEWQIMLCCFMMQRWGLVSLHKARGKKSETGEILEKNGAT